MQLIEIKEKVRNTKIPKAIFDLLWEFEVDTVDGESPDGQTMLTDQMQRATIQDDMVKIPLSKETQTYLLHQVIPKLMSVVLDDRVSRQLQQLQARLNAKLTRTE
jgi:hypothetical protein